jgi:hypothetical protein
MGEIWNCCWCHSKIGGKCLTLALIDSIKPFTDAFPRANIHELFAPDLLHQVIKGVFMDHIIAWVEDYLKITWGKAKAKKIMDELDRR